MEIFLTLLLKLIPLYVLIFFGYIAGRYLKVTKESIASLSLNIIAPIVLFTGIISTPLTIGTLSIPLFFFLLCTIVSLFIYFVSGFIWKDSTRNILALTAGSGNTGYFGLPVIVALFGTNWIGIVALIVLGTALFANSIGFFLAAKGHHTTKESLLKLLKLPLLYAFLLGVLVQILQVNLGKIYFETASLFNGAFIILGMMLIGIAIAEIKKISFDFKYLGISFFAKFILWPLCIFFLLYIDSHTLKLYNENLRNIFIIMAFVPIAANVVSYATVLKTHPEKVSVDVMVSTLIALILTPLAAAILL